MRIALVQHQAGPRPRGQRRARASTRSGRPRAAARRSWRFPSSRSRRSSRACRCGGPPPLELAETVPGPTSDAFAAWPRSSASSSCSTCTSARATGRSTARRSSTRTGRCSARRACCTSRRCRTSTSRTTTRPATTACRCTRRPPGGSASRSATTGTIPEVMRSLGLQRADVVVVPQAGMVGEWPDGLYEAELRVAAFQNGYFTALANRVGDEPAMTFAGESFVCDPSGRVIARGPAGGRGDRLRGPRPGAARVVPRAAVVLAGPAPRDRAALLEWTARPQRCVGRGSVCRAPNPESRIPEASERRDGPRLRQQVGRVSAGGGSAEPAGEERAAAVRGGARPAPASPDAGTGPREDSGRSRPGRVARPAADAGAGARGPRRGAEGARASPS